jgi:hypothetical protein
MMAMSSIFVPKARSVRPNRNLYSVPDIIGWLTSGATCCSACNQRFKRNLFPLLSPAQRARQHADDYRVEQPLFVHPAEENPEEFISFRQEIPYAINGNQKGKRTIEALGLNREIMNERRREHLKMFSLLEKIVAQKHVRPQTHDWLEVVANAEQWLLDSSKDSALFAGVARAKSRGW